jgi:hypothetical protein
MRSLATDSPKAAPSGDAAVPLDAVASMERTLMAGRSGYLPTERRTGRGSKRMPHSIGFGVTASSRAATMHTRGCVA